MSNIKIAFHFENKDVEAYSGHRIDLDNWRLPAKSVGITTIDMIDLSDARWHMEDQDIDFTAHDSLAEFETMRSGENRIVYIETLPALIESGHSHFQFNEYPHDRNKQTYYCFGPAQGFDLSDPDKEFVALPVANALPAVMAAAMMGGLIMAAMNG